MTPGTPGPIRSARRPWGCAAVLLPHRDGDVAWADHRSLIERTAAAGLTPAVNMDTGFVQLLDIETRRRVLAATAEITAGGRSPGGPFLAGAFVADDPGDAFDLDRYLVEIEAITSAGGTPVIFPSHGLNTLDPDSWIEAHRAIGERVDAFIGFELGEQFVPYGRIYPTDTYRELLGIASCIGAKHSSLSWRSEWERIALRDEHRPDFHVLTGNDLAIDMICWGSDYLLGLAAFCPDHFARRDAAWASGDPIFYELNDLLQFLGAFSFRAPVPAYRHDAAMFLAHRGWITGAEVPAGAVTRPESDRDVLAQIAADLEVLR